MRRLGLACLGAAVGHLVGWFLAICWAGSTGNLMMPSDVYAAKRKLILSIIWLIVGISTVVAALLAAWVPRRRSV
jgi:hypothetical protein